MSLTNSPANPEPIFCLLGKSRPFVFRIARSLYMEQHKLLMILVAALNRHATESSVVGGLLVASLRRHATESPVAGLGVGRTTVKFVAVVSRQMLQNSTTITSHVCANHLMVGFFF